MYSALVLQVLMSVMREALVIVIVEEGLDEKCPYHCILAASYHPLKSLCLLQYADDLTGHLVVTAEPVAIMPGTALDATCLYAPIVLSISASQFSR